MRGDTMQSMAPVLPKWGTCGSVAWVRMDATVSSWPDRQCTCTCAVQQRLTSERPAKSVSGAQGVDSRADNCCLWMHTVH